MAGMSRTSRTGLFLLGFLAATGVEAVRAEEAFLCDGGRIVKVSPGQLEDLRRTDACVAAFHGLKIKTAPRLETGAIAPDPASEMVAQPPAARVEPNRAGPQSGAGAAVEHHAVIAVPTRPLAGTDYRNVVLLNAAPGQPGVFRHDR
jgi:hypothetical protein